MPGPGANPANPAQAVEQAAVLYRQGKLDEAEKICARRAARPVLPMGFSNKP